MKLNYSNDEKINELLDEIQILKKENELLFKENKELKLQLEAKHEISPTSTTTSNLNLENTIEDEFNLEELFNELQCSKKSYYENFNLVDFFTTKGFSVIDKRPKGGALWILAGDELNSLLSELVIMDVNISQSPNGGRTTKNLPAWFTKDPR